MSRCTFGPNHGSRVDDLAKTESARQREILLRQNGKDAPAFLFL